MPLSFTALVRGDLAESLATMGKFHGFGKPLAWRTERRQRNKVHIIVIFSEEKNISTVTFEGKSVSCRQVANKHATKPKRVRDHTRRKEHTKDQVEGDMTEGDPRYADCHTRKEFMLENSRFEYYDDYDYDSDGDSVLW